MNTEQSAKVPARTETSYCKHFLRKPEYNAQLMRAKLLDSRFTAPSFLRQKKNIEKETNAMHGSK